MMSERTPRTLSWVGGDGVRAEEALAQRVQRAGADVAVDDAERGEGQGKETASSVIREWLMRDQRRSERPRRMGVRGTVRQKASSRRPGWLTGSTLAASTGGSGTRRWTSRFWRSSVSPVSLPREANLAPVIMRWCDGRLLAGRRYL